MNTTSKRKPKCRNAAHKANETRAARAEFRRLYPQSAYVAQALVSGQTASQVAEALWTTVGSIAAVRANLNRPGRFRDLALACRF